MKTRLQLIALFTLTAVSLIAQAHPGHDGDQTHGVAWAIIAIAAYLTVRRAFQAAAARKRR